MLSAGDFRKGITFEMDGSVYTIVEFQHVKPGKGAQLVRAAGNSAQLMAKEGKYAHVRLPSGEVRLVRIECRATLGQVGNTTIRALTKKLLVVQLASVSLQQLEVGVVSKTLPQPSHQTVIKLNRSQKAAGSQQTLS